VDLLIRPTVTRVGLLDWAKYNQIISEAHADTRRVLREMGNDALADYR
jgi:hypothetical protein